MKKMNAIKLCARLVFSVQSRYRERDTKSMHRNARMQIEYGYIEIRREKSALFAFEMCFALLGE